MTDSFTDSLYPEEPVLEMPDRLRGLLRRMSADGTEIPNPVSEFTEKWKNVCFSTPLYERLVYKMYNYLNNPELNLEYSRFSTNANVIIELLSDVLSETRTRLDSKPSQISFTRPRKAAPEIAKATDEELRILAFITGFLSL